MILLRETEGEENKEKKHTRKMGLIEMDNSISNL